ncbi:ribonuclease H-like domain-containing protein [Aquimonas sp.]|jgi:uncharacterized protein YprB with RNaseH-like and TPR domain|uniref:ribonuclease H-like domain-containing protein n=1 Tax=Aquimonas sp. TaxID=1872588 RepID=UPI0037BE95E2
MSALAERLRRLRTEAGARAEGGAVLTALGDAGSRPEHVAVDALRVEVGVRSEVIALESAAGSGATSSTQCATTPSAAGLKSLLRRHLRARDAAGLAAEHAAAAAPAECDAAIACTDEAASDAAADSAASGDVAVSAGDNVPTSAEHRASRQLPPAAQRLAAAFDVSGEHELAGHGLGCAKAASSTGIAASTHPQSRLLSPNASEPVIATEAANLAADSAGIEIAPGLFERIEHLPLSAPPPWQWLPDVAPQLLPTDALLHFDTETTGLAGGAGTRAFMLGYSRWSAAGLELRQLWITRLGAEAPMLERFAQWLSAAPVQLVSYNGRSFDAPLLAARYRLSRQRNPLTDLPHHDLLPAVRRRFKAHWPSCRMAEVEARLLGIERHDDLPGAQAPAAFLQALRHGRMQALQRVVLHHRQDLISLALLLPRLAQMSSQAPRDWALARVEVRR